MIAYISLEYSSDGPPPSQIDKAVHQLGLRHHGTYFMLEANNDADLHHAIDKLHELLRGTGARYRVSLERPDKGVQAGRAREEVLRWADTGMVDETLVDLLERDVYEFKQESLRTLEKAVDHVVGLRQRELLEEKNLQHREAVKEEIGIFLRTTGGRTFQEILEAFDMDEVMLEGIMQEMIDEGTIEARQKGHIVIYTRAAPAPRPLAR